MAKMMSLIKLALTSNVLGAILCGFLTFCSRSYFIPNYGMVSRYHNHSWEITKIAAMKLAQATSILEWGWLIG